MRCCECSVDAASGDGYSMRFRRLPDIRKATYRGVYFHGNAARTRYVFSAIARPGLTFQSKPRRAAAATASAREFAPSLLRMWVTWVVTVRGLMKSASAISCEVWPGNQPQDIQLAL